MAVFAVKKIGLRPSARILVALSGGPDSSALLLALCLAAESGLLPMPVGVAHFHHQLRGSDADADAAFAATLAATRTRLPCVVGLGVVPDVAGQSQYSSARIVRYEFLIDAARDLGADTIATAHTFDDQAETVLGRVLRGTGLAGLTGIPASRQLAEDITVIRPLLSQRRRAVEAFCAGQDIVPRHDPSNDKDRYARSRLRKQMPGLARDFNPRLADSLVRLADLAAQDNDLLQTLADQLQVDAVSARPEGGLQISIAALRDAHPALRGRVLLAAIRSVATEAAVAEAATSAFVLALDGMILKGPREIHLPDGLRARIGGEMLTLSRDSSTSDSSPEPFSYSLSLPGSVSIDSRGLSVSIRERHVLEKPVYARHSPTIDIAYNATEFAETPFLVRSSEPKDRIAPLGMGGRTRAVRDILAEAGIAASERLNVPVVVDRRTNEIIWVVGLVQCESTRVTPGTSVVLRLSAEGNTENL